MPAAPSFRTILLFGCLSLGLSTSLFASGVEPESKAPGKKNPPAKPGPDAAPGKEKKEPEGKEKEPGDKAKPDPGIHVVEAAPFTVKEKISGVVESTVESPIAFDLERWTDLTVIEAVPHGAAVKAGEVILRLDREALEEKIEELEDGMPLKGLELETAELELDKLEKSTPISLETARRSQEQAEKDLAYFEEVSRPMREKAAAEDLKSVTEYLAYAQEELDQLEKMYKADDITEETEEIILRRARNSVNESRWRLEQTEERVKRSLETTLPREHENLVSSLELKRIDWAAGEKTMRDALEKKRLEVAAKRRETEESRRSLEEYRQDLASLTVKAPHDGIVYYGMSQRGKWITAATVERKLIPGGKLSMNEIVMTVVDPSKRQLRLAVPEDKLKDLAPGQDAAVSLKWSADEKLSGKVQQVSHVPFADNTYDCVVSLGRGDDDLPVFPGMNAEAEIVVYENEAALTVPKRAVREEGDEKTLRLEGDKSVTIETGRTQGDLVEVTKGIKAGARVILPATKPEEKKDADGTGDGAKPATPGKK